MTPYYNIHAVILDSKGFEDKAMEYWEESSQMDKPSSAFANLTLAQKNNRRGDIKRAFYYLDKIPDNSFVAAYKYELSGDIFSNLRHLEKASGAYERSIEINSGRRGVRKKLIKIYWRKDKQRALEEYDKLEYISSFYGQPRTSEP